MSIRARAPAFLAAVLLWLPVSVTSAQAVSPGDDFFSYANADWLKSAVIPSGRDRWSVRNEIDAIARERVKQLLDDAGGAPKQSLARKVADFRAAYLNEAAIEARGIAPLKPLLDSIDGIEDKAGLVRLLGRRLPADVDPLNWGVFRSAHLLGLSVEPGLHGEKTNVALLVQGGLGLTDRNNYVGTEPKTLALRARYQEYIGRLLTLAGFDRGDQRAASVLALETAIAETQATSETSALDKNSENRWTRADFASRAPGMDWAAFFAAAGLAQQEDFVAWQPSAVTGLAAAVASQPLANWKDYLRFQTIDRYAALLPRAFADQSVALHAAESGDSAKHTRAERALEVTERVLGEAVGRMYTERYFPPEQKARVRAIEANVRAALMRRIDAVTWMSPASKAEAVAKLKALYFGAGYPEHWQDYSDLVVDPGDALGNLRRGEDREYRHAVAKLGRPVDLTEWWISPHIVGGLLVFQQNALDFSAALLQPPKFDPAASDAESYGAIGAIVGHEMSHYIDLLGAEWSPEGKAGRWWTAEDISQFGAAAAPLVQQFSSYQPFPNLAVDGQRTRSENIADLAGLSAAFDAYRQTLGSRASDVSYVRQQDREFFLAFARSWRSKLAESALRTQLSSDIHAPDRYRIATVRNLDAWYNAFQVMPGQKLYLEPAARVRIW